MTAGAHSAGTGLLTSPFPILTAWKAEVMTEVQEPFCKPANDRKAEWKAKGPWDAVT